MEKIKIGIIGAGMAWERLHFPAYQRLGEQFEIVAVCDRHYEKAKRAADWLQLPEEAVFTEHEKMLSVGGFQAVDAMVPIAENDDVAKAVLESGKHLIAEKPFASTPESAKKLITLAKKKKAKVLVAENFRYAEENSIIKEIIMSKKLGNVVYFIDNNVTEFQADMLGDSFSAKEWRQHPNFKGGIFLDSAVHHIARMRFLFGDIQKVSASGRPGGSDFCEYSCIHAMFDFLDHVTGHYSYFNIGKETQSPAVGLRIFCTAGEIYLENKDCCFVNVSYKDGGHEAIPYQPEEGYYNELLNFYNALSNNEKIVSTPEKALGDIEAIFAILSLI